MIVELQQAWNTVVTGRRLVSNRIGVIADVLERRCPMDSFTSVDHVGRLPIACPHRLCADRVFGGGSAARLKSQAAAIGESVERYCLSIYDRGGLTMASFADAPPPVSGFEALDWFIPQQYESLEFPFQRITRDMRVAWVQGFSLTRKCGVSVPASLVYLPYKYEPGEKALSYQISVGTSCARSLSAAACRAILELVERDALTICWESHTPFPPIVQDEVQLAAETVVCRRSNMCLLSTQVDLRSFDLTTDIQIPVVLTLAVARTGIPAIAIGVAADLDPWWALVRSIEEVVTSWRSTVFLVQKDPDSVAAAAGNMRKRATFLDHALYYAASENLGHFDFLLKSMVPPRSGWSTRQLYEHSCDGGGADSQLAECARLLSAGGHDAILFDLTQPDVDCAGLKVVRAVAPTLARQSVGLFARHLGCRRIAEIPRRLGYVDVDFDSKDLLELLYPFP